MKMRKEQRNENDRCYNFKLMDKNLKWKNKYRFVYIKIEKYTKAGVGRWERQLGKIIQQILQINCNINCYYKTIHGN